MNDLFKKTASILSWIALINLSFYLLAPEVYSVPIMLTAIVLLLLFTCIDILIRPISARRDEFNPWILAVLFLLVPFALVLPFHENRFFISSYVPELNAILISYAGIFFLVSGGIIDLVGRIQLGKYGGPKIVVEEEHRLITRGLYTHVRHPMYLGFLLLFFGFCLTFRSYVFTFLISGGLFLVLRSRMEMEERLLISKFGQEYLLYARRTKRLIPFLY